MALPQPVLPDYEGANIARLTPSFLMAPDRRPAWIPEPARSSEQVVLLVVDGLGWLQMQSRLGLIPNLASMAGRSITTVVPSTTATALTSLTVGVAPAAHGIVGYRVVVDGPTGPEVLNVLRWKTLSGDARQFVQPREFQPLVPFGGHRVPVVSKSEFNGTGFTDAHQREMPVAGWSLASSLAVEVRRLVEAGEPFVYAYYEGVDKIAHIKGFGEHYDAELMALDRIVGDLLAVLPPTAALAVTADHGQVQVGQSARVVDLRLIAEAGLLSGEGRFRWLHARPEAGPRGVEHLRETAMGIYGEEAWIVERERMEDEGWFGGKLRPEVRARLGDVALIPWESVAYLDPADSGDAKLVCRHGSLTDDEMLVPLVATEGRLA